MNKLLDWQKEAEKKLAKLALVYPNLAQKEIQKLKSSIVKSEKETSENRKNIFLKEIFPKIHDLKGQGATFGYPLVSEIGENLCRYIEDKKEFNSEQIDYVKKGVEFLEEIIQTRLLGNTKKDRIKFEKYL